jgi:hypothetical protein
VKRREFIAGLGGALAWPTLANALDPPTVLARAEKVIE